MKDGWITPSSPCAHERYVMGNIRHEQKKRSGRRSGAPAASQCCGSRVAQMRCSLASRYNTASTCAKPGTPCALHDMLTVE